MNLNDWEFVWRCQPLPIGDDADVAKLKQTFEWAHHRMQRTLLVRDLAEALAGLIVVVALGSVAIRMPGHTWPILVASAITLGVTGYFIWERIRSRRLRIGAGAPMLTKVEADIHELRHQCRLLLNIWRWYLGPIAVAWTIVMLTVLANLGPNVRAELPHHPAVFGFLIGYVVLCVILFWGVARLNRRAVQRQLGPRLAELEKLYADLTAVQ